MAFPPKKELKKHIEVGWKLIIKEDQGSETYLDFTQILYLFYLLLYVQ